MKLENEIKRIYIDELLNGLDREGVITIASISGFQKYACNLARFSKQQRFRQERPSTFSVLEKFKDDPNIYLSYIGTVTDMEQDVGEKKRKDVPKLGINPKSHYNTPLGIYTYPLSEIWERIEESGNLADVPYQGEQPYIAVLRLKPDRKFVNDMYNDYDSSDFDKDLQKMLTYFVPKILTLKQFNGLVASAVGTANEKNPISSMWNVARYFSFLAVSIKEGQSVDETVDNIVSSDEIHMPEKSKGKLNPYALTFNRILNSVLGYDGFADKSGRGYIHKAEPTQAVFLNPRSYDVLHILENTNSNHSDRAHKEYEKKEKLKEYISNKSGSIAKSEWEGILYYHPDLLIDCPYPEPLKNEKVKEKLESYWSNKFSDGNIIHVNSNLPHLAMLPKTKKVIFDSWKKFLKNSPEQLTHSSDNIPEFVLKDKNILKTVISGWKSKILNDAYSWEDCPYEVVKYDEEILESVKEFFETKVRYNVVDYEMVPEYFKNDSRILEVAKSEILTKLIDQDRALIWTGIGSDLRAYLSKDSQVMDAVENVWSSHVYKEPILLTKLPAELDYDKYSYIAKKGLLNMFESKAVEDIYGRFDSQVPEDLANDPDIMKISAQKWKERISEDNFQTYLLKRVPDFVLKDSDFWNKSYNLVRQEILINPRMIPHDIPKLYEDAFFEDESIWKELLLGQDYDSNEWLRLYDQCVDDELKESHEVKQKATYLWKARLMDDFGYHFRKVPKSLQAGLAADPELKEKYYRWLKNEIIDNPHRFKYEDAVTDIQKKAYKDGFTEFLLNRPLAWDEILSETLETLLKDPKIYESVFNEFKNLAMSDYFLVSDSKLKSPFGDELYKNPEVIAAIKENIKTQLFEPGKPIVQTPLPELINTVKVETGDNDKIEHYKQLLIKNPDLSSYYQSILSAEEWGKISAEVIEYYKDYLRKTGIITKDLPRWLMGFINDDESMREVVFNAWYRFIDENNIPSIGYIGGIDTYYHTPPKYVYEDPKIQYLMDVNQWYNFLQNNIHMADINSSVLAVPEEYRSHPKVKNVIDTILQKAGKDKIEPSNEIKEVEDNLSYSKEMSKRTVWASYFNDNIIVNF